jgi:hypothetical protein
MRRETKEQKLARAYAQHRLTAWGNCVRRITMAGTPRANIYSRQPFSNERLNFDMKSTERQLFAGRVWDLAIEVDELLMPIREADNIQWRAVIIRYVIRHPGGVRRLDQKDQLRQFRHSTGKGKTAYYTALQRVEQFLAMALGV